MIDAFHLPALPHPPTTTWAYGKGEAAVQLRLPQLTPALLQRQLQALHAARAAHLAERPVADIVAAIDAAAARLADPDDVLRRAAEAALPHVTGYSPAMVRRVLDHLTPEWRAARLWELLRSDFGDPELLDGFRRRPGLATQARAYGPTLTTHLFSGSVPGVAVTALVRALLVKSASLAKTATGEPVLAPLFARALAEVDAGLGDCVAVAYWATGAQELEREALAAAEAVIAHGSAEAVAALRAHTPPRARFLGHVQQLSFGVIARERLTSDEAEGVAARAALEVATFDQQGCASPHLFYVEEGGEVGPHEWARLLAQAMERLERALPRGTVSRTEASAIRHLRSEAEFARLSKTGTELFASATGTAWTVVYEPDPTFAASCRHRAVRVKPVADLGEVPTHAAPIAAQLQTVGVAAAPERLRELAAALGRLGASRVTPLGRMAWPPATWHHDGRPPLAELVRWTDLEI